MNVVIFAGSGIEERFSEDYHALLKSQGHRSVLITDKANVVESDSLRSTNYSDFELTLSVFERVLRELGQIDLLVYHVNNRYYPDQPYDYHPSAKVDVEKWRDTLFVYSAIPHAVANSAMAHMPTGAKIIFISSFLATYLPRTELARLVGYAGGLALQNHLAAALSHHTTADIVVCTLIPDFDFSNEENYSKVFSAVVERIDKIENGDRGKYLQIWNGKYL